MSIGVETHHKQSCVLLRYRLETLGERVMTHLLTKEVAVVDEVEILSD